MLRLAALAILVTGLDAFTLPARTVPLRTAIVSHRPLSVTMNEAADGEQLPMRKPTTIANDDVAERGKRVGSVFFSESDHQDDPTVSCWLAQPDDGSPATYLCAADRDLWDPDETADDSY
jgi:hypothetical protein